MNHTSPLWSLLLCFSTHNRKTVLIRHLMVAVVLFLSVYQTLFAQAVAFLARTNNANVTPVGHTATDGKPKALVFIQQTHQNLSPGKSSANCGYPVGVSYKSGKWNLECLLADAAIPDATLFNIMVVPTASACAFKHTVTQSGQSTPLDNPLINGNPNATLVITQDFTNGVRNAKFVGVKYENSRWHILNEDGSTIPAKTQFNVFVADKGFTHIITTTNSHPSWPSTSIIRNAATDSKKDIFLFVTHRYKSKYIPSNLSVWYENVNWHGFVTTGPAIKDYAGEEMSGYVFSPQNSCAMPLRGWVDMHTHPMSHLGFGRKAMHGAPGLGCIIPAGTHNCNRDEFRATSIDQALGNCNSTHGGWGTDNDCGDYIRAGIINYALDDKFEHKSDNPHGDHHHAGYPALSFWPNHTSILHQQMWSDWIRRARDGGLRVMVALTVNSELLAEIINGDGPYDDKTVADIQIDETVRFVNNNRSFMEIAYSKADLERIVRANKIAVVLGMEVDKIGNFGKSGVVTNEATVRAEIQRLYNKGIRYVFPIHLVDNSFGGAAVYEMLFNFANKHANGRHFSVTTSSDPNVQYRANATDGPLGLENGLILGMRGFLEGLGQIPAPCFNDAIKCFPPPGKVRCCGSFERILGILSPAAEFDAYKFVSGGHVNSNGLTPLGEAAIDEMMKLGMMIDIDHMSERSMTRTIELAERRSGGYPLNMGHNGIRGPGGNERGAPIALIRRIATLGGMMGTGTAEATHSGFASAYRDLWRAMGNRGVAIGSDVNGFEPLPHRSAGKGNDAASRAFYESFFAQSGITSKCSTGNRTWDYVKDGGVSHYGIMPEFLHEVKINGGEDVVNNLNSSAEHFAQMWGKCERLSTTTAAGITEITLAGISSDIHNNDCRRFYGTVEVEVWQTDAAGNRTNRVTATSGGGMLVNWDRGPAREIGGFPGEGVRIANTLRINSIYGVDRDLLAQNRIRVVIKTKLGSAHKGCDLCTDFTWEAAMPTVQERVFSLRDVLNQPGAVKQMVVGPYAASDGRHSIRVHFEVR